MTRVVFEKKISIIEWRRFDKKNFDKVFKMKIVYTNKCNLIQDINKCSLKRDTSRYSLYFFF